MAKGKDTPKGIFREKVKKFDSSNRMNFADSSGIKTPELVHLRDLPVDTDDEPGYAHVATGISDEDRVRRSKLREIGSTEATHYDPTQISEKKKVKTIEQKY